MLKTSDFVEVGLLQIEDVGRLTKREMIAAMAMQGILAGTPGAGEQLYWTLENAPKAAIMLADKLISEMAVTNE